MAISAVTKKALFAQETRESFPILLTISHPKLSAPIRVTDNDVDLFQKLSAFSADETSTYNDVEFFVPGAGGVSRGKLGGSAMHLEQGFAGGTARLLDDPAYSGLTNMTLEFWLRVVRDGTTATDFPNVMQKSVDQCAGSIPVSGMYDHSSGLIHHHEKLIFEQDIEWNVFRKEFNGW